MAERYLTSSLDPPGNAPKLAGGHPPRAHRLQEGAGQTEELPCVHEFSCIGPLVIILNSLLQYMYITTHTQ